jgi:uracil-DNA glycosylase
MNKKQRKKADAILFKNCRGYLRGELEILSPDLLVTQGNEAKKAIKLLKESTSQIIDEFSSIIKLNGKHIFWLHTYHPNNWGAFNKQRDYDKNNKVSTGWVRYSDLMHKFVTKNS